MGQGFTAIFCILVFALVSCRTNSKDSELKHQLGELSADPHELSCQQKTYSGKDAQYVEYTKEHLKRLVAANREQLPAIFSADKFCVEISSDLDPNASGQDNGIITMTMGLVKAYDNDADFAAIIAHEMAHIINTADHYQIHKDLADDNAYMAIIAKLRKALESSSERQQKIGLVKSLAPLVEASQDPKAQARLSRYERILIRYLLKAAREQSTIDPYTAITKNPFDPIRDAASDEEMYAFINLDRAAAAQLLTMAQDCRQRLLSMYSGAALQEFIVADKKGVDEESLRVFADYDLTFLNREKTAYEKNKLGVDVGSNWKEQSADEIGYEMYLRAGWAKDEFPLF
ncbi:MAG: M48 family metalloprotease, partial [Proteobacteria bacterium]|nr:M48 family metalloprotease [Pseudomonadota bacterium]